MRSSRARWNITRNWEPLHNILASDPDTEKTLNDTYFSAWNTIPPHEPRTYLFPYLARITRCLSIDLSKKGWRSHQCRRVPVYRYDQDLLRNHKLTKLDKLQKSRLLRQWEHFALCNRTRNNRLHGPNAEESSGNTLLENSAYRITALSAYGHKVSLSEPIKCFSLLFFEADVHFVYRFPAGVDRYITWIFTPGGTYERDERRFSRGYLDDPNENESDYVCSVIDY